MACDDPDDYRSMADDEPNPDPRKQRMRDEQDALLAGMRAAREAADPFAVPASNAHACWAEDWRGDGCEQCVNEEAATRTPSPAAGAVALAEPWLARGWYVDGERIYHVAGHRSYALHTEPGGKWTAWHMTKGSLAKGQEPEGPNRQHRARLAAWNALCAASQYGLTPADAVGGTPPAAAASADVHGLGDGWVRDAGSLVDAWFHKSGASVRIWWPTGEWLWFPVGTTGCPVGAGKPTAAEAARLALGTAPAVVRGDGAIDWEAVRLEWLLEGERSVKRGLNPSNAECVVAMLRVYHEQTKGGA